MPHHNKKDRLYQDIEDNCWTNILFPVIKTIFFYDDKLYFFSTTQIFVGLVVIFWELKDTDFWAHTI